MINTCDQKPKASLHPKPWIVVAVPKCLSSVLCRLSPHAHRACALAPAVALLGLWTVVTRGLLLFLLLLLNVIEHCYSVAVLVIFTIFFAYVVLLSSLYFYSTQWQLHSLQALLVWFLPQHLPGLCGCKYVVNIKDLADNNRPLKLLFWFLFFILLKWRVQQM